MVASPRPRWNGNPKSRQHILSNPSRRFGKDVRGIRRYRGRLHPPGSSHLVSYEVSCVQYGDELIDLLVYAAHDYRQKFFAIHTLQR